MKQKKHFALQVGLAAILLALALGTTLAAQPGGRGPGPGPGMIERFDLDGDGKLSADEFVQGHQKIFAELDANSDGFLDQDEAAAGPPRRGFIDRFDENDDGLVSAEEFDGPAEVFTELDANSDGFVDADEAPQGPPRHRHRGGRDGGRRG